MSNHRLPAGMVYSGRGELVNMDDIKRAAERPAVKQNTEIKPMVHHATQEQPRLRGYVPSTQTARPLPQEMVTSANTPDGEIPTLSELTGVRIDRLKHIRATRTPTAQEVEEYVNQNVNDVTSNMIEKHASSVDAKTPTVDKGRRRTKTEAEKLAEEI